MQLASYFDVSMGAISAILPLAVEEGSPDNINLGFLQFQVVFQPQPGVVVFDAFIKGAKVILEDTYFHTLQYFCRYGCLNVKVALPARLSSDRVHSSKTYSRISLFLFDAPAQAVTIEVCVT
jgi:hypothetical protein